MPSGVAESRPNTFNGPASRAGDARVTIAQNKELTSELDAIKPFIENLLGENGKLTTEVAEAATKDVLIQALRRRTENLNAEYHGKVFPRKATTLEDVYKLTGEIDKHGNRSKDH